MNMTEAEAKGYEQLVDEMRRLAALPDLSHEQAERWASLSGTRLALYAERDGWMRKAVPVQGGRWQLVPMPGPATLLRSQAEAQPLAYVYRSGTADQIVYHPADITVVRSAGKATDERNNDHG